MPKPEKKHDFTVKEIQAGALVLASVAVLAGFIAIMNGMRVPEEVNTYYAKFTNTIGLKMGAEVRFGGTIAGRVVEIVPDAKDQTQLLVKAHLQPTIPVNQDSIATIETLSLTSEKHLEISTGSKEAKLSADGSELKSVTKSGGFIDIPNIDGLVSGSEDLIGDLRDLLGVEAAQEAEAEGKGEAANVTRIMADLRKFLGVQEAMKKEAEGTGELVEITQITEEVSNIFKKYEPQLQGIVEKVPDMQDGIQKLLDQLNGVLEENGDSIGNTMKGVEDLVTNLRENADDLINSLKETLENTKGLTGDANEFLMQNRPVLEDMLGDLGKTVSNLNVLLNNLKNNPESVLWGKPAVGRK